MSSSIFSSDNSSSPPISSVGNGASGAGAASPPISSVGNGASGAAISSPPISSVGNAASGAGASGASGAGASGAGATSSSPSISARSFSDNMLCSFGAKCSSRAAFAFDRAVARTALASAIACFNRSDIIVLSFLVDETIRVSN